MGYYSTLGIHCGDTVNKHISQYTTTTSTLAILEDYIAGAFVPVEVRLEFVKPEGDYYPLFVINT